MVGVLVNPNLQGIIYCPYWLAFGARRCRLASLAITAERDGQERPAKLVGNPQ
jgi:hypothetical protein